MASRTPAAVKVAPASKRALAGIDSLKAEGRCKAPRPGLEGIITAGITFPVALPSSCEKVDATVRDAVAASLAARSSAGIGAPFEVALYQRVYRGPDAESALARDLRPGGSPAGLGDDVDAVVQRVRDLGAAGVGTVVLMPSGTEPDPAGYLTMTAEEVVSRLRP